MKTFRAGGGGGLIFCLKLKFDTFSESLSIAGEFARTQFDVGCTVGRGHVSEGSKVGKNSAVCEIAAAITAELRPKSPTLRSRVR